MGNDGLMEALTDAGFGLDYDKLSFGRTTELWLRAGSELREQVAERLDGLVRSVEQVGSSSVLELLAKPIVDLAVGLGPDDDLDVVTGRLAAGGWIYRGDAGDSGGHVFVLEKRPSHRIAHIHVVEYEGSQWSDYVRLRDLLRRSPKARDRYEAEKVRLAEQCRDDRKVYQERKSAVVESLLHDPM